MPGYANPQSLNRYAYVNNNPLKYTDPTGHMLEASGGGAGSQCPDRKCVEDVQRRRTNRHKDDSKNIDKPLSDFVTVSAGISIPSVMILAGGLLCLSAVACEVGGPLAESGLQLVGTPANALSVGPALTLDSYGNTYLSFQGAAGKTVPGIPIGGEIVSYKLDSSHNYAKETEDIDFITGWNIASNSIGVPGMSGFRLPPTGKSVNPVSGETATSGTFVGTTIAEITVSYTWKLPLNIGNPSSPWASP